LNAFRICHFVRIVVNMPFDLEQLMLNQEDPDLMPLFSVDEDEQDDDQETFEDEMPILALKNTVLFPGIIIPITVGRDRSIKAIRTANDSTKIIAVVSQKDPNIEFPTATDIYHTGTVAQIIKLLRMPDGTTTAILRGKRRFTLKKLIAESPYMRGEIEILKDQQVEGDLKYDAIISSIRDTSKKMIRLSPQIPAEANVMLQNIKSNSFLVNFVASNLSVPIENKQQLLQISDPAQKAQEVHKQMNAELQILEMKSQLENKVRGDIEKQQRDYFLSQQLKTIQNELGQNPQEETLKEFKARAEKKKWSKEVQAVFDKELKKISRINPAVAEYSVTLNYLDLLLELPWDEFTVDNFDLKKVQEILDADHFGLEKVKERIIEHLAVLKLKGDMKAPILLLLGPPGVGKTSLGKSIARAIDRKYIRMSLGGLHDESEIRGHRRTYIGAMPGRILQALKKAKASNPVFILDEIDKVGKDFRGDPSSALLEVLDPEQNSTFHDNFLEMEYDLSKVMFIATANSLNTIQPALLDRMEIIRVSGYSSEEKIEIAKRHLIPEQRKEHGLQAKHVKIGISTLKEVIANYTRESGVRSLNRRIGALMRNVAKEVAMDDAYTASISPEMAGKILGPSQFSHDIYAQNKLPGVAVGLAWTSVGGDILFTEVSLSKGKGTMTLTGNLGDVMKESASTALSFLKANCSKLGIDEDVFKEHDIHIHVPAGAIPKDGPSAGITMLTALASAFTGKPVKPFLAMTGESTLRGIVLPVGGIKEKILAAKRAGIKQVILPKENEKNVLEIEPNYLKGLNFEYVEKMMDVLNIALQKK